MYRISGGPPSQFGSPKKYSAMTHPAEVMTILTAMRVSTEMEVMERKYLTVMFMREKKTWEPATKRSPVLFAQKTATDSGRYRSKVFDW